MSEHEQEQDGNLLLKVKVGDDLDIIRWRDSENKSFREIGRLLGLSHVAVRKRYLNASRKQAAHALSDSQHFSTPNVPGCQLLSTGEGGQAEVNSEGKLDVETVTEGNHEQTLSFTKKMESVTKSNICGPSVISEVKYLKKMGTPDWDYFIATPILEDEARRFGKLFPYDPKAKRFIGVNGQLVPEHVNPENVKNC